MNFFHAKSGTLITLLVAVLVGADSLGGHESQVEERELVSGDTITIVLKQRDIAARWTSFKSPSLPWLESQGRFVARPDGDMPILSFFSQDDRNRITIAASDLSRPLEVNGYLKYQNGSEIEIVFRYPNVITNASCKVRIDRRDIPYWESIQDAAGWMSSFPENRLEAPPDTAFESLWNSWYAYRAGITAKVMEAEGKAAAALGIKTIMYDMGWDRDDATSSISFRPCGDWNPSTKGFPDMKSHIAKMHDLGLRTLIWFGYPLMGTGAMNFERYRGSCLGDKIDHKGTLTLDPRKEASFELVSNRMCRALRDWNVDGFKIDFIQSFAIHGAPYADVLNFEDRLASSFAAIKKDVLIEYMSNYGGIRNLRYATHVRASDCPGDSIENRMRTVRLRLLSGPKAVHCDMLTWDDSESVGSASVQIISVLHSVLQFGRSLITMNPTHRRMVSHWLAFASKHRETLLRGDFLPHGAANACPVIEMVSSKERIFTVHQPNVVCQVGVVDRPTIVVNGSGKDTMIVETTGGALCKVMDEFGEEKSVLEVPSGVTKISCPLGGHLLLVK